MTGLPLAVVTLLVGSLARYGETATTISPCTSFQDSISVKNVLPPYGPVSGDTEVYLFGQYPWSNNVVPNITVFFGDNRQIAFDYLNYIQEIKPGVGVLAVKTPNVLDTLIGVNQTLHLVVYDGADGHENGCQITTNMQYEFRATPVVDSITPLKSFLLGGLIQTVSGRHFDSLFHIPPPQMTTTIIYLYDWGSPYKQQPTNCTVINSTTMTCPAPKIDNPPSVELKPIQCANSADLVLGCLNRPDYQYYVGLNLRSTPLYHNVSEFLPEYGIMMTFLDPVVEHLDPVRFPFRVYKEENIVELKGDNLNLAWGVDQYTVTVGAEPCEIVYLSTNRLSCKPPQSQPHHGNHTENKGSPQMRLTIGNYFEIPGYLAYYEKPLDDPVILNSVIGICVGIPVLVILIVLIVKCKQYMMKELPDQGTLIVNPKIKPFLKNSENLKILKKVGEGFFGVVYSAEYKEGGKTIRVAAKTLTRSDVRVRDLKEFLDEAIIMKNFEDVNVLPLTGVVDMNGRPYVLTPFMDKGDLRTFLLNPQNKITMPMLFDYSLQVARGMSYLSSIGIVHRDLAARNCMLSNDNVVKIADFGLARSMSNGNEYDTAHYVAQNKNQALPIKWMAPDTMETYEFSSSSDMWACGVVLWEIFTRGKLPYGNVPNSGLMRFLIQGKRLEKPNAATEDMYRVMLACWQPDPRRRPTATDLVTGIQNCFETYIRMAANLGNQQPTFQASPIRALPDVTLTMPEDFDPGYVPPTPSNSGPMRNMDQRLAVQSDNRGPHYLSLHQDNLGYMRPQGDQEGTSNDIQMLDPAEFIYPESGHTGYKGLVSGSDSGSRGYHNDWSEKIGYINVIDSFPDPHKGYQETRWQDIGADKSRPFTLDFDPEAVTDNQDGGGYVKMSPTAVAFVS